ncbi:hydroxymethylbilane synthase [Eubacterium sp. AB3007]|uniref:hydroxymethylbilane synthase n=1 Tax=Eubacterium sp. AB3007 TaxID=1392487 RepID=UPI0005524F58|nr:hydroxymethylbilane synthase [Eubacterium sp. AB3007]
MKKVRIGSRESRLAMIQSNTVVEFLASKGIPAELVTMKTTGDKILNKTLDKIGGKGLFVKELDQALVDGRSDLSVHSLKDMPMEVPAELPILAFSRREDPRDVLVLPEGETEIDFRKPIGSSSFRRRIQIEKLFPQARVESVRGNVQTRLRKLDEGQYGAIVLAAAGLKRLGLEHRISRYFSPQEMLPAAGQGILVLQGRAGEDYSCLEGYEDPAAACAALAERAFVRWLDGGCTSPIAAHAVLEAGAGEERPADRAAEPTILRLEGLYYDDPTGRWHRDSMECSLPEGPEAEAAAEAAQALGVQLAKKMKEVYR